MLHPRASNRSAISALTPIVGKDRPGGVAAKTRGTVSTTRTTPSSSSESSACSSSPALFKSVLRLLAHSMVWGDSDWEKQRMQWRRRLGNRSNVHWRMRCVCDLYTELLLKGFVQYRLIQQVVTGADPTVPGEGCSIVRNKSRPVVPITRATTERSNRTIGGRWWNSPCVPTIPNARWAVFQKTAGNPGDASTPRLLM